jgi:hypothetical protein
MPGEEGSFELLASRTLRNLYGAVTMLLEADKVNARGNRRSAEVALWNTAGTQTIALRPWSAP